MLRIMLKNQVYVDVVDGEFKIPAQTDCVSVYACTDGISCWIGDVFSVEDLNDMIAPENILEVIRANASCDEYEVLEATLSARDNKYKSYDNYTVLTAIN